MKKTITKLSLIALLLIAMWVFNEPYNGQSMSYMYGYSISLAAILSLAVGLIMNGRDLFSRGAIAIYGASITVVGAIVGAIFIYNLFSVLGSVENDLYIFDTIFLPGCILAISIETIGLVIVACCLKKNALLSLIPFAIGTVASSVLLYNMYISCSLNELSKDIPLLLAYWRALTATLLISGTAYWGLVVYKVKHSGKFMLV